MQKLSAISKSPLFKLLPFWLFVVIFKFGAALHYTLLAPLGARILPLWVVGIIVSSASLVQLIFDIPAGFILDRYGYIRLLKIATATFVVGALFFVHGLSLTTYLTSIALGTIGWLFYSPGISAYVLSQAPREHAGTYMGTLHAAQSLGVVGATVALGIALSLPVRWIGFIVAGLLFISLSALFAVRSHYIPLVEKKIAHQPYYIRRTYLRDAFIAIRRLTPASRILVVQGMTAATFYGMVWFTIPLVIAAGSYKGFLGISLSVFDFAIVALGSVLGSIADSVNKKMMVLIGLLMFAICGAVLGFNFNLWFLLLGFLATAGDELSGVALWAWLDHLDSDHSEDGVINGVMAMCDDLGWTIGPLAAGFLFTAVGPAYTLVIGSIPLFLTWLFSFFLFQSHHAGPMARRHLHPLRLRHKH